MAEKPTKTERVLWGSKIGVVLAVAGSAVGLGNFLRFPGQAAQNGGGAFMVPYFIMLLLVGIPLAWAEWTMGRYAGVRGFHSAPGVFAAICRSRWGSLIGSFALLIPLCVYMYYVVIEAWCLGYAYHYLTGALMQGPDPSKYGDFFNNFTGATGKGDALNFGSTNVMIFVGFTFVLNFCLILLGLVKGIESFCKIAMPMMIVCAVCVLVRVLTLGTPELDTAAHVKLYQSKLTESAEDPERHLWLATAQFRNDEVDAAKQTASNGLEFLSEKQVALKEQLDSIVAGTEPVYADQSVQGGLNFMWNPDWSKLLVWDTWLAAAGQIFFSLSVGFGVIVNYASYLRRREDIALSGLTAASTNEFFEVVLGGLITLPAAFIFLGVAAGTFGTFGLGFNALPNVFAQMPGGQIFGFLWFFMLFLAAITSSLSMLQPVMSFIEEGLGLNRIGAACLLGILAAGGCSFVVYYSEGLKALDTIDFWVGTFLIVVLATVQSIVYGWVFGAEKGHEEVNTGAAIKVPGFMPFILRYVSPVVLSVILVSTIINNRDSYITELQTDPIAARSLYLVLGVLGLLVLAIGIAVIRWTKQGKFDWVESKKVSEK